MPDEPPIDQAAIGTHSAEPELQEKAALASAGEAIEAAPATVDENLDMEATVSEPAPPASLEKPKARSAADSSLETTMVETPVKVLPTSVATSEIEDDLFATIAAAPESPARSQSSAASEPTSSKPVFTPPPGLAPSDDDANATLAAEEPPPTSGKPFAASPPPSLVAPAAAAVPSAPNIQRSLDESVTLPSADRPSQAPAATSNPAAIPSPVPAVAVAPLVQASAPGPAAPRGGFRLWWIIGPIGFLVIAIVGANLGRQQPVASEPVPSAATPLPKAGPDVPQTMPPVAAATPAPATTLPTPAPPAGEPVTASELERFAETDHSAQPLLLTGTYRVSTSTPPAGAQPGSAVMRPSDAALSGKIRVMTLFAPGAPVPSEGSTISIDSESRYFIKEVRRGADGQINVRVEQK